MPGLRAILSTRQPERRGCTARGDGRQSEVGQLIARIVTAQTRGEERPGTVTCPNPRRADHRATQPRSRPEGAEPGDTVDHRLRVVDSRSRELTVGSRVVELLVGRVTWLAQPGREWGGGVSVVGLGGLGQDDVPGRTLSVHHAGPSPSMRLSSYIST